jgi:hypothetical protein
MIGEYRVCREALHESLARLIRARFKTKHRFLIDSRGTILSLWVA